MHHELALFTRADCLAKLFYDRLNPIPIERTAGSSHQVMPEVAIEYPDMYRRVDSIIKRFR